jgi:hypothetical protein
LHLFAHFEERNSGCPALQTQAMSIASSPSRPTTQAPSSATRLLNVANELDEVTLPPSALERPAHCSRPIVPRRSNVHDLSDSDSDSDGSGETNFLLSPSDSGRLYEHDDGLALQELSRGESQHTLPSSATAAQHAIDFEAAIASNAPKDKYGHKDNWHEIAKKYRQKIAHAKLIKGMYGIPSSHPCERCASKDIACRIYNPDLQAAQARSGSCGECRLGSSTCVMNGSKHRKSGKKRTASDVALNEPLAKILRRSTGGDPVRELIHCPVLTCPRREEPFSNKSNLLRHVTAAHPDYDSGRLDLPRHITITTRGVTTPAATATTPTRTSRGMGTFVCPIADCPNPTATRGDNMRRHIRQKHPESVHAQILEASLKKTKISIPPPPSSDEFTADFEQAMNANAPPGAFGHRSNWITLVGHKKINIGHAKLIQGKYGVISPESCANCRKRDTTCMMYQYVRPYELSTHCLKLMSCLNA